MSKAELLIVLLCLFLDRIMMDSVQSCLAVALSSCFLDAKGFYLARESRDGAVVRALAFPAPMWAGFDSRTRRHMWVEFIVGSLLCSERFFSRYSGFPLSSKTNISKFQFDPGMHGHF